MAPEAVVSDKGGEVVDFLRALQGWDGVTPMLQPLFNCPAQECEAQGPTGHPIRPMTARLPLPF